MSASIYHIATRDELERGSDGHTYTPARFSEDGFVHCTAQIELIDALVRDYFSDVQGELVLLVIDPDHLDAEVRVEAPSPISGGGREHLATPRLFPHVYGPIELSAIVEVRTLRSS